MTLYDDGNWHAVSMGVFLQLLVDAGQDPAVAFRVTGDSNLDVDGQFTRRMEIVVLPNGYVMQGIQAAGADVHTVLGLLIERGLVR